MEYTVSFPETRWIKLVLSERNEQIGVSDGNPGLEAVVEDNNLANGTGEGGIQPGTYTKVEIIFDSLRLQKGNEIVFQSTEQVTIPLRGAFKMSGGENIIKMIFDSASLIRYNSGTDKYTIRPIIKRIRKKSKFNVNGKEKDVETDINNDDYDKDDNTNDIEVNV